MDGINLKHDPEINFARGTGVNVRQKNGIEKLSKVMASFQSPALLPITRAEFDRKPRSEQDKIKAVNTCFAGALNGGFHGKKDVLYRSMLALDLDFATPETLQKVNNYFENTGITYVLHSTLKSTPKNPRYRLYVPLDTSVMETEYVAISRRLAGDLDIEWFDPTTYDVNRLMFGPAVFKDTIDEFVFAYKDGRSLGVKKYIETYDDYKNTREWPTSSRENESIKLGIKKQTDPLEKGGVVGAFCRTYNIHEVIEAFLGDVYEACDVEDRYTFREGSTSAGLVVYDDMFSFSHHGTDPTGGKLCNPWDLVRIHLFESLDEGIKENTPSNKLPSYLTMLDFAIKDPKVKKQLIIDKAQSTKDDFATEYKGGSENIDDWRVSIEVDRKGATKINNGNGFTIAWDDQYLKLIALNEFSNTKEVMGQLPWREQNDLTPLRDSDLDNIVIYCDKEYSFSNETIINRALRAAIDRRRFHPVRDYLNAVRWDGEDRVDTVFIDYLGAEDNQYTRMVTRISLVAAVARIFQPGIPYDQVVILVGGQGIGKSTVLRKLGKHWFSDNFAVKGTKEDIEQLLGRWIIEIGELVGIRSREVNDIKSYISRTQDETRLAFGKEKSVFPRQCVFFGTTNETNFLTDATGNRRFWPVKVEAKRRTKSPWEDLKEYQIDQIWAEAVQLYNEGEPLVLSKDLIDFANNEQGAHTYRDDRTGVIQQYLDKLLPENWGTMDYFERRRYLDDDELQADGTVTRQKVSISEIWCECFGENKVDLIPRNTRPLHDIMRRMEGWEESGKGPERVKNHGKQTCYIRKKIEIKKASMIKSNSLTNSQN